MLARVLVVLGGYVFGLFQTGYFLGKSLHKDIRSEGSGNAGATNALRVFGLKAGITVFAGDLLKSVLYCLIIKGLFSHYFGEATQMMMFYGGIGVVLGHTYPFYLGFKGGKGIASTAGVILAFDWRIAVICFALFLTITLTTQYVSLASLSALTMFLLLEQVFLHFDWVSLPAAHMTEMLVLSILFVAHAFFTHRANLVRLAHGNENKTNLLKKK